MTVPVIAGMGGNNSGGNVTTSTPDIAALTGTPAIGDLILIFIIKDGTGSFTWPGGWTGINDVSFVAWSDYTTGGSSDRVAGRYRVWQSGDSNPAITHATEATAWVVYRIKLGSFRNTSLADDVRYAGANGSTANPDPPISVSTTNEQIGRLFIAVAGNDGNVAITAGPSGFSGFINTRVAASTGCGIATAYQWEVVVSTTKNPGVFTMASTDWATFTIWVTGEPTYEWPVPAVATHQAVPRASYR